MSWIRSRKDFVCGVLLFVFGILVLSEAFQYRMGTARNMGPGYFPVILGSLTVILSIILVVRSVAFMRPDSIEPIAYRKLGIVLGAVVLYALALRPLGLPVALGAMILVAGLADEELSIAKSAVIAVCLAAGSSFVFAYLLDQSLPLVGSWMR